MKVNFLFNLKLKSSRFFLTLVATALLMVTTLRSPAVAATAKHYDQLTFPPLPEIQIPEYTRYQLENGMTVYLVEDHELPLVEGTALFRTGSRFEPDDKVGLASLTGEVMRTGGTQSHPPDELNQLLEQKAASIESGVGETSGSAGFSALTEDLSEVFELFAEVVQDPSFTEDKLELAKTQRQGSIARRNDDPNGIAGREFQKLIYGPESPYARTIEYVTLDNIQQPDLINFYQQYFHPENMILGIVGDFDPEKMKLMIANQFGSWKPERQATTPPIPEPSQANNGGVFFVSHPQLNQSYIQMGHM
ncbi:MAG: M16 family metallopeptidase, partial [Microcoleaceae cyanobacterium]